MLSEIRRGANMLKKLTIVAFAAAFAAAPLPSLAQGKKDSVVIRSPSCMVRLLTGSITCTSVPAIPRGGLVAPAVG